MNALLFCNLYALVEYHCIFVRIQYAVFHIHSSQPDILIHITYAYVLMIRCCGRFRGYMLSLGGGQEDASASSLPCAKYGHVICYASRKG